MTKPKELVELSISNHPRVGDIIRSPGWGECPKGNILVLSEPILYERPQVGELSTFGGWPRIRVNGWWMVKNEKLLVNITRHDRWWLISRIGEDDNDR